jgi:hypothetical protein
LRQRRSAILNTRSTAGCSCAIGAKPSSNTQSMRAPGTLAARSDTSGSAWTMSPIDEVLTIRMRGADMARRGRPAGPQPR